MLVLMHSASIIRRAVRSLRQRKWTRKLARIDPEMLEKVERLRKIQVIERNFPSSLPWAMPPPPPPADLREKRFSHTRSARKPAAKRRVWNIFNTTRSFQRRMCYGDARSRQHCQRASAPVHMRSKNTTKSSFHWLKCSPNIFLLLAPKTTAGTTESQFERHGHHSNIADNPLEQRR